MGLYKIIFSPTGTSSKIADAVVDGIRDFISDPVGTHAEMYDCSQIVISDVTHGQASSLDPGENELAVFAAPVYGGKMAPIAKDRMRTLKGKNTPCVLIAVYGNRAFENALNDMADFVRTLGFIPVAAGAFIGEHSYSTQQYPVAPGRPDREDLESAREFGFSIAKKIFSGNRSMVDVNALHDHMISGDSLMKFYDFIKKYQESQKVSPVKLVPQIRQELCTECGACVDMCPTGAISSDFNIIDASLCIKCCACVKGCPSDARILVTPFSPILSECFADRKNPVWTV